MKQKVTLLLVVLLSVLVALAGCAKDDAASGDNLDVARNEAKVESIQEDVTSVDNEIDLSVGDVGIAEGVDVEQFVEVGAAARESDSDTGETNVTGEGNMASVSVKLTVEPPIFSVGLPVDAFISYDRSTGKIVMPDLPISNKSAGPIYVASISAHTNKGELVDLTEFFTYEPPISKGSIEIVKFIGADSLDKKTAKALDGQLIIIDTRWWE